jgi:hypothetical protein
LDENESCQKKVGSNKATIQGLRGQDDIEFEVSKGKVFPVQAVEALRVARG